MKRLSIRHKENPAFDSLLITAEEFKTIFEIKNFATLSMERLYVIDYGSSSTKMHDFLSLIRTNTIRTIRVQ